MREEPASQTARGVNLPASTSAPLYLAFGLALALVSLVTSELFAYAGLVVSLWGAVGWWREMLPMEKKEFIAAPASDAQAPSPGEARLTSPPRPSACPLPRAYARSARGWQET